MAYKWAYRMRQSLIFCEVDEFSEVAIYSSSCCFNILSVQPKGRIVIRDTEQHLGYRQNNYFYILTTGQFYCGTEILPIHSATATDDRYHTNCGNFLILFLSFNYQRLNINLWVLVSAHKSCLQTRFLYSSLVNYVVGCGEDFVVE